MTSIEARRSRTTGRSVLWAALGGLVGSLLVGIPMAGMGMIVGGPAALVGSDSLAVGWAVHLLAGLVFGAPFGLMAVRPYGQGALLGAVYGLAIGVVFAWLALFTILGMPLFTQMGLIDVVLHTVWGVVVGLVAAWGLHQTGLGTGGRRRLHRVA